MRIIAFVLTFVINIYCCAQTPAPAAAKPLLGAFGVKFNTIWQPRESQDNSQLQDGETMYAFTPKPGLSGFSDYYVMITPITHKVYSIWACAEVPRANGLNFYEQVVALYEKKYGKGKSDLSIGSRTTFFYPAGSSILIKYSSDHKAASIDIRYYNRENEELAKKERIEKANSGVNTEGI